MNGNMVVFARILHFRRFIWLFEAKKSQILVKLLTNHLPASVFSLSQTPLPSKARGHTLVKHWNKKVSNIILFSTSECGIC